MEQKFTDQKFEKEYLTDIEKEIIYAMQSVTFLPASYDKRFFRSLYIQGTYTWKQKRYLHFIFNKYRKQIKNYKDLALRLEPERFKVNIEFKNDLFSQNSQAEIYFEDTFKPKKFVDKM